MEAIEVIFKLILMVGFFAIFAYVMSFITGGIAKIFGTTNTLNGRVVATPDTLDNNIRDLKELKNKFLTTYNKYKSKLNNQNKIDIGEQIRLLSELEKLKENNIVRDDEYHSLRKKIMNEE
jgi:hypothetical protein